MSAGDAAPPPRSLIRQVCVAVVAVAVVAVASIGAAERRASAPSDSEPRLEVVQRATPAFAIDRVTWLPADAAVCSSVCLCSTPSDIDWIQLSKWIRVEWSGRGKRRATRRPLWPPCTYSRKRAAWDMYPHGRRRQHDFFLPIGEV